MFLVPVMCLSPVLQIPTRSQLVSGVTKRFQFDRTCGWVFTEQAQENEAVMSTSTRQITLRRRPMGWVTLKDFEIRETILKAPNSDHVHVCRGRGF